MAEFIGVNVTVDDLYGHSGEVIDSSGRKVNDLVGQFCRRVHTNTTALYLELSVYKTIINVD